MKWQIHHTVADTAADREAEIIEAIFSARGISTSAAKADFLADPSPVDLTPEAAGIDAKALKAAVHVIKTAIKNQVPILIYGDYDADGITATAILWETLYFLGAKAYPFIPNRNQHGYGLSVEGLHDALAPIRLTAEPSPCLVITVDNGIVAHEAVRWLQDQHIPVIITDHHQPNATLPAADIIVHSQAIAGAGVAWVLAKTLAPAHADTSLDLVCIGTVADMMPLIGVNRWLVKRGLPALQASARPGIKALLAEARVNVDKVLTPTDINYVIAPRLNAMGRLEHAINSLRLLCTKNPERARELATLLGDTNRNRQDLTQALLDQAKAAVGLAVEGKIIVIDHEAYHEGIIGLIAGKLVETYYRPSIVICRKDGVSKASARSIRGVNVTELIRSQSHLLLGVGGHPMAAGFSIATEKIDEFRQEIVKFSATSISEALLEPSLDIDCGIELSDVTESLYHHLQNLQPFGIGNPTPVFSKTQAALLASQTMGNCHQHLKLLLDTPKGPIEALWFGHGSLHQQLVHQHHLDLAFTIDQNTWKNKTKLQLLIKDIV